MTSSEVVQKNPSVAAAGGKDQDKVVILSYLVNRQAATCRDAVAGTEYTTFPSWAILSQVKTTHQLWLCSTVVLQLVCSPCKATRVAGDEEDT